ncbi:hypothetical protein [Streptomyces sp. NPDC002132]|uniref:hypothetical protein n=1 Tax=unclassified Streptomyces TaxID=2593676 RepID=UPI00332FC299
MPLSPGEAVRCVGQWWELGREQILALRMVRRLLAPVRGLAPLLAEHPRWAEVQVWERLAPNLP